MSAQPPDSNEPSQAEEGGFWEKFGGPAAAGPAPANPSGPTAAPTSGPTPAPTGGPTSAATGGAATTPLPRTAPAGATAAPAGATTAPAGATAAPRAATRSTAAPRTAAPRTAAAGPYGSGRPVPGAAPRQSQYPAAAAVATPRKRHRRLGAAVIAAVAVVGAIVGGAVVNALSHRSQADDPFGSTSSPSSGPIAGQGVVSATPAPASSQAFADGAPSSATNTTTAIPTGYATPTPTPTPAPTFATPKVLAKNFQYQPNFANMSTGQGVEAIVEQIGPNEYRVTADNDTYPAGPNAAAAPMPNVPHDNYAVARVNITDSDKNRLSLTVGNGSAISTSTAAGQEFTGTFALQPGEELAEVEVITVNTGDRTASQIRNEIDLGR